MARTHYRCTRDPAEGMWMCPDGIGYFVPTMLAAAVGGALVLLSFAVWEAVRADAATRRMMAEWATVLGAGVLGVTALFLLLIGFPVWLVVPYVGLAGAAYAVRDRPRNVTTAVLGPGVVLCLLAMGVRGFGFLLTLPALAATALAWTAALALLASARPTRSPVP